MALRYYITTGVVAGVSLFLSTTLRPVSTKQGGGLPRESLVAV